MRDHGLPEPVFEEVAQTFRVTLYGPGGEMVDLIPEEGVTDLKELGLNERQVEALRWMVNEGRPITNREYCELFEVSTATATRDPTPRSSSSMPGGPPCLPSAPEKSTLSPGDRPNYRERSGPWSATSLPPSPIPSREPMRRGAGDLGAGHRRARAGAAPSEEGAHDMEQSIESFVREQVHRAKTHTPYRNPLSDLPTRTTRGFLSCGRSLNRPTCCLATCFPAPSLSYRSSCPSPRRW